MWNVLPGYQCHLGSVLLVCAAFCLPLGRGSAGLSVIPTAGNWWANGFEPLACRRHIRPRVGDRVLSRCAQPHGSPTEPCPSYCSTTRSSRCTTI
eukprot:5554456-Pyramimonas_sp.AAC.1